MTHQIFLSRSGADTAEAAQLLARSGFIPRFRSGCYAPMESTGTPETVWHVVKMRPGDDPFAGLRRGVTAAANLPQHEGAAAANLRKRIDPADPEEFLYALHCDLPFDAVETLLLVDQAEELVRQCKPEQASTFLDMLVQLAEKPANRVRVLLTVRSDYFKRLSGHPLYDRLTADPDRTQFTLRWL